MNSFENLEIPIILEDINQYAITQGGHHLITNLRKFDSHLVLDRELSRMREALLAVLQREAPSFSGISDITASCVQAGKMGILSIEELVKISQFGFGVETLFQYYKKSERPLPFLSDLFENLVSDLKLSKDIDRCFSRDFEVYDNATPLLASIRKQLQQLDSKIGSAITQFIQKNSEYLTENLSTIRSDRTVLPVKTSFKHRFKGIIHNQSASGMTTFVEPQFLIDLNNERQSLLVDEHQEIVRICKTLSEQVGAVSDQYIASYETAILLDSLFARAKWAKARDGVVATLSEKTLSLKEARHPLLDPETVITNNYRIEPPIRMLLITGPNTGGKTVGLKTIGTSVYLTHCGIPVLASEAMVPFVDDVYVDIGDRQSISQSLSTFSAHIQNLKLVLDHATAKSLVLLDELGVGTDPVEGESLASAILESLQAKDIMTVATTHYNRLKVLAQESPKILNASVEFDVETLRPTYRFIEGIAGQSYALDIASRLDLDPSVIERANSIKEETTSQQEQLIESLEQQILLQNQINEELKEERESLRLERQNLSHLQAQIESEKESSLDAFKQSHQKKLNNMIKEAQFILEEVRNQEKSHEVLKSISDLKEMRPIEEVEEVIEDEELAVGDTVRLRDTQQVGTITEINKKQAMIDVRGLRMSVPLSKLRKHTIKKPKKKPQRSSVSVSTITPMALEVNVIGLRVEEALVEIGNYLDQATLNKLSTGRIIHGHGTGALRSATHEYLKKHKAVKSYRLGGENEGGVGATVVTFRAS